ncbi:MAG TPA: BamA/TamA family outer membrane protein [Desulfuromonadaceae bacterium]|jgi:hypothetical protein
MFIRPLENSSPALTAILLLIAVMSAGCTSYVKKDNLPCPLINDRCQQNVKIVTVPLPVIASSPNEGITVGALSAFLIHNKDDEINTLIAPQVNYNKNFGVTTTLYSAFYPAPGQEIEGNFSQSTKVNYDYELRAKDGSQLNKKLELNAFVFTYADGSARFFGFQAKSPLQQETNYTDQEAGFNVSAGYQIANNLQFFVGDRFRAVSIHKGAVTSVPFIKEKFVIPGMDGFTVHTPRLSLVYSTLDSKDTPTSGKYARATFEPSLKFLGSTAEYRHYEAEVKGFVPLDDESKFITVFRLMYNQTLGEDVPFLEQSILGGETTLRGYGRNRFIDNTYFLANLEQRIRLFRWAVFNVTADWEIAPFIDFGAVMDSLDKARSTNFEFNPGIGFRATVRPNIVGRVDMGIGRDGPAIFVGLGYPF